MLISTALALAACVLAWLDMPRAAAAVALPASLAGLVAWVLTRRAAREAKALAAAMQGIVDEQRHDERLPVAGPLATLARPFNGILDDLARLQETLRLTQRDADRRLEEDTRVLQHQRDDAEAASLAKTRFLANMSHELRTPLNGVIGAAQLLKTGGHGLETQAHLIEAIRGSGANLLGLIENILDLSRIETGALELAHADFNLIDCVESAIATTAVAARMKRIEMACIIDPQLPAWRHGDNQRLRQVVLNLLGNAVKFTQVGEVVLTVEPGARPTTVLLSVGDTGVGIAADNLPHVFDPFRQADETVHRQYGGSGLGLSISHQLVSAMGGRIRVQSELGRGTRFDIELDLPLAHARVPDPPPLPHVVLVFEPHEASAQALLAQLTRLGCRGHRCRDADELRHWVQQHQDDTPQPWLLVAADTEQTWDFIESALPWIDAERVIGMTQVESHEAESARERVSLPRSVVKPVLRSSLVSRLGAPTRDPQAARHPAALAAPPTTVPAALIAKHVLVVEDDRLNQTIVCGMLHNAGYTTTSAEGGEEALELMSRQIFDLVLMDWQMPDMDGLEVTRRIRRGEAGRYGRVVPIVALTANAFAEDRAACLAAGMNDFLTKPVLASMLIETTRRWTALPGGDDGAFSSSNFADLL